MLSARHQHLGPTLSLPTPTQTHAVYELRWEHNDGSKTCLFVGDLNYNLTNLGLILQRLKRLDRIVEIKLLRDNGLDVVLLSKPGKFGCRIAIERKTALDWFHVSISILPNISCTHLSCPRTVYSEPARQASLEVRLECRSDSPSLQVARC